MTNATTAQDLVAITGGTGKTGRRLAERLRAAGVPVRLASRRTQPAFEWDAPQTWPATLDGASALYVAYAPDLAVPGAAETVRELAEHAVAGATAACGDP